MGHVCSMGMIMGLCLVFYVFLRALACSLPIIPAWDFTLKTWIGDGLAQCTPFVSP
jgi:hypothetical protein